MTPIVYLLAQGKGTRWTEEERLRARLPGLPPYKHLMDCNGTPLIRRSLRLLQEAGFDEVRVVAGPELLSLSGCSEFGVTLDEPGDDILLAARQIFNAAGPGETTVLLLGDVLFSRPAIAGLWQSVCNDEVPSGVLVRDAVSAISGKAADEVFGLWAMPDARPGVIRRIDWMLEGPRGGPRPNRPSKPWAFPFAAVPDTESMKLAYEARKDWGLSAARRLGGHRVARHWISVNDYTDDVDSPIEASLFWPRMVAMMLKDDAEVGDPAARRVLGMSEEPPEG